MLDVFSTRSASLHQLNALAEWVRQNIDSTKDGKFDVIRFVELDLPNFFPGIYVEIENDSAMGKRKAYISDDPLGIIVAESVYNRAAEGCLNSAETILHEVGHIFLHYKYSSLGLNDSYGEYRKQIKDMKAYNSAEWQAKSFAMCVIFPYSEFRKYTTRLEIQVYFNLNVEQSERVLAHITKLRMREAERNQQSERRWIESVVASTREFRRTEKRRDRDTAPSPSPLAGEGGRAKRGRMRGVGRSAAA